jgi:hypothetical protein
MALSKSLPPVYSPTAELQRRLSSFECTSVAPAAPEGGGRAWDDDAIRRELERLTAEHENLLRLAASLRTLPANGTFPDLELRRARVGYDNPPDQGPARHQPGPGPATSPEPPPAAEPSTYLPSSPIPTPETPDLNGEGTPMENGFLPANEPPADEWTGSEPAHESGHADFAERAAEPWQAPERESGVVAELFAGLTPEAAPPVPAAPAVDAEELEVLRLQNAELRNLVEQAIAQEEEFTRAQQMWQQQQAEFAQRLEQRDREVQQLTGQVHELEEHVANLPVEPPPPKEDELSRMADELDAERCQITKDRREMEEERQQLREDEEALMKQMREMEVQMAKERAEMARQRTELQRLHAEIRHELEQLQRGDGALKDRLAQFQRRHSEVFNRNSVALPPANGNGNGHAPPPPAAPPAAAPRSSRDSGIMRRFFGNNGNTGR